MSLYINLKLFGIVAFIMIFSLFAANIIFDDENQIGADILDYGQIMTPSINEDNISYYSLPEWCLLNYQISKERWQSAIGYSDTETLYRNSGISYAEKAIANDEFLGLIESVAGQQFNYHVINPYLPDEFIVAFDNPLLDGWYYYLNYVPRYGMNPGFPFNKEIYDTYYNSYVDKFKGGSGGLVGVFGGASNAIKTLLDVVTFNFKDQYGNTIIPLEVRIILGVFMTSLGIILLIGILPLVALLIQALTTGTGNLVFDIIKGITVTGIVLILIGVLM